MVGKGALFTVMVLWISNAPQITGKKKKKHSKVL